MLFLSGVRETEAMVRWVKQLEDYKLSLANKSDQSG